MMKRAIYPGSFDPITNGHMDIIERASRMFDEVVVLLAINPNKSCRFEVDDRLEMLYKATKHFPNVTVDFYDGLTIDYAKKHGATAIIRGLRVVTDFEYEWGLSSANAYIDSSIEMIFLMAHQNLAFISSSSIDELYKAGVDISKLVPSVVLEKYKKVYPTDKKIGL